MTTRLAIAAAALAALALAAAPAEAREAFPSEGTDIAIATHLWGMPSCGRPTVVYGRLSAEQVTSGTTLLAWSFPGSDCTITLNADYAYAYHWDRNFLCTTIVHEWGHLTGHSHVLKHGNPMYPASDDGDGYWRCHQERATMRWLARPVAPMPQFPVMHAYLADPIA